MRERKSLLSAILISMINFYRRHISPAFPPCCRYQPTCSQYALEAISVHGAFKGAWLAFVRILRCNPFSRGGYDPVPPAKGKRQGDGSI